MKSKTQNTKLALATLSVELQVDQKAPSEIQLTPVGFFRAKDGRPEELPDGWYIDESVSREIIYDTYYVNERVIDYEHQSLRTEGNGQPAPAAGWFGALQWRESGLWAINVVWTPTAQQMIVDKEYRYISPVIQYDPKTGHVLDVLMAALTNNPAIDGMANIAPLTIKALHQRKLNTEQLKQNGDKEMKLSELLAVLGLPEGTTEESALEALSTLKENSRTATASVATLTAQVASLEKASATVNPAEFVPIAVVADMQSKLAALTAQASHESVDLMISDAIESGHLLPSQKKWATELGKTDQAALSNFIATAVPVTALTAQQQTQHGAHKPEGSVAELTADQRLIRQAFKTTDSDFK